MKKTWTEKVLVGTRLWMPLVPSSLYISLLSVYLLIVVEHNDYMYLIR